MPAQSSAANPLLEAALDYARRGWRVVPLHGLPDGRCQCGKTCGNSAGKHPWVGEWQKAAAADEGTVRGWWAERPASNVGMALGGATGLVAVDVDSEEGERLLAAMAGDDVPDTPEFTTGKGRRLLYAIPDGLTRPPQTRTLKDAEGREAIQLMGLGRQTVMPPCPHYSGKFYAWVEGRSPADLPAAPMPAWLVEGMCMPERAEMHEPGAADAWGVGANFNRQADWWADILEPRGFKKAGAGATGTLRFTRPDKEGGVSVTVGHYRARDGSPALYIFSGSIPELPAGKCFDKFGAFTRLFHGGNFKLAAQALAGRYGTPRPAGAKAGAKTAPGTPAAPTEWPEPYSISAASAAPPEFPLDVFPAPLVLFCRSAAATIQCPPDFLGTYLLGVSAGLIGGAFDVAVGPKWTEPAILWTGVVADVSAYKSPALKAVMEPVKVAQATLATAGDETVLFTDDATAEGLVSLLRKQPRGTLYADDELVGLVAGFNQYKQGGQGRDRQTFIKLWDGGTASTVRKNPDAPHVYAPHARLSIVGAAQPAVAGEFFTRNDGLPERLLMSYPVPIPRGRYTRGEIDHADDWALIADGLRLVPQHDDPVRGKRPYLLRMDAHATRLFDDWTEEVAGMLAVADRDRKLDGTRGKLNGHVARLALVLRCLRAANAKHWTDVRVERCDVEGATLLGRYYLAHAERVRADMSGAAGVGLGAAASVVRWVRRKAAKQFSRRDVHRDLGRQFPKSDDLRPVLRLLVQHGFLRYVDPPAGSRGEATYETHPTVFADPPGPVVSALVGALSARPPTPQSQDRPGDK